nr:hypothetical protein GCM10020093_044290 [Planobispora longispora]
MADLLVADEVLEQADERHGGGDVLLAGALLELRVGRVAGERDRLGADHALGQDAAQGRAALLHVGDLGVVLARVEVRRQLGVQRRVRDRQVQPVAELLQLGLGHLLHLVRRVARLEVLAERPALDGLGEDDRRLADVLAGRLEGRVDLAVVVAAARQLADVVVGQVLDHLAQARVAAEEVLADVLAGLDGVGLELAVGGGVHLVDEHAVDVGGQQRVPVAAPHDLDDVPAGAAEVGLQLLDDLSVAADRAVEALQVAVDDEGEVVELLAGGQADRAERLRLVHLAVAQEAPDVAAAGVLHLAVEQVAVEPRLVDRADRAQAHGDRGELPEVRHEAGVRVGGQALEAVRQLLTEGVELGLVEAALQERAGVDARGGVALEEDLVAGLAVVLAAEEVVEAHLVERRGGGVGGDVPADVGARVGPGHHDRGVPPDVGADPPLDVLVAGEPGLALRGMVLM